MLTKNKLKKFSDLFDIDLIEISRDKKKYNKDLDKSKTIVECDLHAPFTDIELVRKTFNENANNCMIIGDLLDNYSTSRFVKRTLDNINPINEFARTIRLVIDICSHFNNVYYLEGNHCQRLAKKLFEVIPLDLLPFFEESHFNILREILDIIPNLHLVSLKSNGREYSFLYQDNDILYSHVEKSYKDTGKTVLEVNKMLLADWYGELNLKPYKCLIQAHTHRSAYYPNEGGRTLIQMPAMIDKKSYAFDYAYSSNFRGKPAVNGYYVLYKDGKNNFNAEKSYLVME